MNNPLKYFLCGGYPQAAGRTGTEWNRRNHRRSGMPASHRRRKTLNRIALNLLKKDKTCKLGIKVKRLKEGGNNDYLIQLLGN
jgi:hypothetical protein